MLMTRRAPAAANAGRETTSAASCPAGRVHQAEVVHDAERLAYEIRLAEIRAELKSLPPEARFDQAIRTNDPMVLDAILSAPPTLTTAQARPGEKAFPTLTPFIAAKQREEALLMRARVLDAAGAAEVDDLGALLDTYERAVGFVRATLLEGTPKADVFQDANTRKPMPIPAAAGRR
jgi:hypothetical protein